MPTAPAPPPAAAPLPGILAKLDTRTAIGIGLGLLCVGVLVGFRIGHGTEPLIVEKPVMVKVGRPA